MQCKEIGEWISSDLDGYLAPAQQTALAEHLRSCPNCRRFREELAATVAAIRQLDSATPPADLAENVRARVEGRRIPWRPRNLLALPATRIAIAAGLLLVGSVYMLRDVRPGRVQVSRSDDTAPTPLPEPVARPVPTPEEFKQREERAAATLSRLQAMEQKARATTAERAAPGPPQPVATPAPDEDELAADKMRWRTGETAAADDRKYRKANELRRASRKADAPVAPRQGRALDPSAQHGAGAAPAPPAEPEEVEQLVTHPVEAMPADRLRVGRAEKDGRIWGQDEPARTRRRSATPPPKADPNIAAPRAGTERKHQARADGNAVAAEAIRAKSANGISLDYASARPVIRPPAAPAMSVAGGRAPAAAKPDVADDGAGPAAAPPRRVQVTVSAVDPTAVQALLGRFGGNKKKEAKPFARDREDAGMTTKRTLAASTLTREPELCLGSKEFAAFLAELGKLGAVSTAAADSQAPVNFAPRPAGDALHTRPPKSSDDTRRPHGLRGIAKSGPEASEGAKVQVVAFTVTVLDR